VRELACVLFHNVLTSAVVLTTVSIVVALFGEGQEVGAANGVRDVSSVLYLRLLTLLLCS
jgi:hypothetical protein